ncbi:hypothetical protein AK812_SmicGene47246 [Symbiodinium microadriaticum]|uniref:Uncharacterized protein n=1 Tax=Symbiodinium microadriaticum TaxID=2951 RepID=A0A1Q9BS34_SYMMI|nr:hypothetical protein AK812_SmicGene47246 [Symbiodinium microadriaticum]
MFLPIPLSREVVGLCRPLCLQPNLPHRWLHGEALDAASYRVRFNYIVDIIITNTITIIIIMNIIVISSITIMSPS